jgi:hypothetical protein
MAVFFLHADGGVFDIEEICKYWKDISYIRLAFQQQNVKTNRSTKDLDGQKN